MQVTAGLPKRKLSQLGLPADCDGLMKVPAMLPLQVAISATQFGQRYAAST